jgi:hypothetical protein
MLVVAKDLQTQYEKALDSASISRELRPALLQVAALLPRFCCKDGHSFSAAARDAYRSIGDTV